MIHVPTAPALHYAGDLAAWLTAFAVARWQHRRWPQASRQLAALTAPSYFVGLGLGALVGAWLLGSANSLAAHPFGLSHSIAGALAGGIVAVELWKWRHGVTVSTGNSFAAPLAAGIAAGRLGCLFAGLADYTYGTPTMLPWAVDLGDGVGRHPVPLYEALTMGIFAVVLLRARISGAAWAERHAFHALAIVYAVQRFVWEFLKPYPRLIGPFDAFHFVMVGLFVYGIVWWRRGRSGAERV